MEDLQSQLQREGEDKTAVRVRTGLTVDDLQPQGEARATVDRRGSPMDGLESQLRQEEDKPSIVDKIQISFDVMARSWPIVQRRFHDRTPPNAEYIQQVMMEILCATSKLLGMSAEEFLSKSLEDLDNPGTTPIEEHDMSGVEKAKPAIVSKGSSLDDLQLQREGVDTAVIQTGSPMDDLQSHLQPEEVEVTIARARSAMDALKSHLQREGADMAIVGTGSSMDDLQSQLQQEEADEIKRVQSVICGPPWGGIKRGSSTCALDCCVMIAILLGTHLDNKEMVGSNNRRLTETPWQDKTFVESWTIKEKPYRWLIGFLNEGRQDGELYTHESMLPLTLVFQAVLVGTPQLMMQLRRKYNCSRCGVYSSVVINKQVLVSPGNGATDLAAFLGSMFTYRQKVQCPKCCTVAYGTKVGCGNPPLKLCVEPAEREKYTGISGLPIIFHWRGEDGQVLLLTYYWSGGVYLHKSHFRVYWRAGGDREKMSKLLLYDGLVNGGRVEYVWCSGPEQTPEKPWRDNPSLLFFTLATAEPCPDGIPTTQEQSVKEREAVDDWEAISGLNGRNESAISVDNSIGEKSSTKRSEAGAGSTIVVVNQKGKRKRQEAMEVHSSEEDVVEKVQRKEIGGETSL